ncbi:SDR family NAD(P)-dependent oxidoreductase [Flavobacterium sp. DG1-102-2]|uniref:SDR family oxidoreductase n=1 Tax=Flavobacterium sp. DG1-102-2 TaxID=3081663 RepID=UPI00294905A2|nr:SDR family NAD(P)-dependent oxidoreductase [Flavobacterium sp. DG1-102-2]MDV6169584.1 SDR family NAD(P)-dependent oxidoreductase [Flavobacterium sp. DG1-102-2]
MELKNSKILVTGGASGIGLGLTKRFLAEGNTVIICGRREDVLNEAAANNPGIITKAADLSTESGRTELYSWIAENHSDLNALVNNAGIQNWMDLDNPDFLDLARKEIVTNIEAPLHLIALFSKLPALKTIVNVTSGLAFVPSAKIPVYSATKAFFHSFTLSARHLLKAKGIEVIELIPPALNTDLGGVGIHDFAPPVDGFVDSVLEQIKEGKTEIAYDKSVAMATSGPDGLKAIFDMLNPAE